MKRKLLSLLLAVITTTAFAQVGTISVTVTSSDPVTGLTSIDYEFTGIEGRTYTLTVEVDFDDGFGYQTIPEDDLIGNISDVSGTGTAFFGTIVWDGVAGFPDLYRDQTRIRISRQRYFTPGDGVTDFDGNVYQTVIIGNQEWMAENLRVTRDSNENTITRYCYDDNTMNCIRYGVLYTWNTIMNGQSSSSANPSGVQGICPTGWHVPSDAEWTQLIDYVVAQGFPNSNVPNGAGNALKSCRKVDSPLGGCNTSEHPRWDSHGTHHGFDEFGFSALPGGFRYPNESFSGIGSFVFWWTASENSTTYAWTRLMENNFINVGRYDEMKESGVSLRCVKD